MDHLSQTALLIVDDHPVYRDAICEKLTREFAPFHIQVVSSSHANEGLEIIQNSTHQWVVLLDILMPGLSGIAGIKVFNDLPNVMSVVAISGLDEHTWQPKALAGGARLFVSKNNTAQFISQQLHALLTQQPNQPHARTEEAPQDFRLTQRQLEVLDLISQGHPNKIIADYLSISEQTVKIHINQIFKELRVFNRTQAVLKAQQLRELKVI